MCKVAILLFCALFIVLKTSRVNAYFGKNIENHGADLAITKKIDQIIKKINQCNKAYASITIIDDKSDKKGFYQKRHIFRKYHEFLQTLLEFLQTLKFFAQSDDELLSPEIITKRSDFIIEQLIEFKKLKQDFEMLANGCEWSSYYPNTGELFEILITDLQKIYSILIAICQINHNQTYDKSLDKDLESKLDNLLNTLTKMNKFCEKIELINNMFIEKIEIFNIGFNNLLKLMKLVKSMYKERLQFDTIGCKIIMQTFISSLPTMLRSKTGEMQNYTQNFNDSLLFWENEGTKHDLNFYKKFKFGTEIFDGLIHEMIEYLMGEKKEFLERFDILRQRLIKKLYDDSCHDDIEITYNCIFSEDMHWELREFIDYPMRMFYSNLMEQYLSINTYTDLQYDYCNFLNRDIGIGFKTKTTTLSMFTFMNEVNFH